MQYRNVVGRIDRMKYFRLARVAALAPPPLGTGSCRLRRLDRRNFFIGAVGIRKDGRIVSSSNGYARLPMTSIVGKKSFPPSHAEYRLCRKLDVGSVVWIYRVKKGSGAAGMAKPCADCRRVLVSSGVKKVYYSISHDEYGVWIPPAKK